MTLHKAIQQLLENGNQVLTAREIANSLNQLNWYSKCNNSEIKSSQILARINRYLDIFEVVRSSVPYKIRLRQKEDLKSNTLKDFKTRKSIEIIQKDVSHNITINCSYLLNEDNFRSASFIDSIVPKGTPGIYCIRVSDTEKLPKEFRDCLKQRNHNILYIGIAKTCLNKRFLGQELRGRGHGTFFRSLGALLGFLPDKSSLSINSRNYKFNHVDKGEIIS